MMVWFDLRADIAEMFEGLQESTCWDFQSNERRARRRESEAERRTRKRIARMHRVRRTCPVCGAVFELIIGASRGRPRVHCSDACAQVARVRRWRAKQSVAA